MQISEDFLKSLNKEQLIKSFMDQQKNQSSTSTPINRLDKKIKQIKNSFMIK